MPHEATTRAWWFAFAGILFFVITNCGGSGDSGTPQADGGVTADAALQDDGTNPDGGASDGATNDARHDGSADGGEAGVATVTAQEAYVKASNTRATSNFGRSVAISSDGSTLAVGAFAESSNATGIGGNQSDTSAPYAGAVYIFSRAGSTWTQQAYVKASNARLNSYFGSSVALSSDGSTLAVGAEGESSNATGIGGNQSNTSTANAGAVYLFSRSATVWTQKAYVKASNTRLNSRFGGSVALSADGTTLATGASGESSNATVIGGNQSDTSQPNAGAVYIFSRSGTAWMQQAYVKASNGRSGSELGSSLALSSDGSTLAVGAAFESSNATGIGGNQSDTSAAFAGAVYIFSRSATVWTQQAYVKASNTGADSFFGYSVALSFDGGRLAVGAYKESSNATGIGGNQIDSSAALAGAVYVFSRSGTVWSQQAYVKASNTRANSSFGSSVALSSDGSTLAAGAPGESSNATGIGGNQSDTSAAYAGAVYLFSRSGTVWSQQAYVKASSTRANSQFGTRVALSSDGSTLAVGAERESSNATGIGGNQTDTSAPVAGAAYVFH
jgi:hypothetical protein